MALALEQCVPPATNARVRGVGRGARGTRARAARSGRRRRGERFGARIVATGAHPRAARHDQDGRQARAADDLATVVETPDHEPDAIAPATAHEDRALGGDCDRCARGCARRGGLPRQGLLMTRTRPQLQLVTLGGVSFVFTVVFAAVFAWVYANATKRATDRLRSDLDETLRGAAASIDAEELVALYREGTPNPAGFSDDRATRASSRSSRSSIASSARLAVHLRSRWRGRTRGASVRRRARVRLRRRFVCALRREEGREFLSADTGSAWGQQAWDSGASSSDRASMATRTERG